MCYVSINVQYNNAMNKINKINLLRSECFTLSGRVREQNTDFVVLVAGQPLTKLCTRPVSLILEAGEWRGDSEIPIRIRYLIYQNCIPFSC